MLGSAQFGGVRSSCQPPGLSRDPRRSFPLSPAGSTRESKGPLCKVSSRASLRLPHHWLSWPQAPHHHVTQQVTGPKFCRRGRLRTTAVLAAGMVDYKKWENVYDSDEEKH